MFKRPLDNWGAAVALALCLTSWYLIWVREDGFWDSITGPGRLEPATSCPTLDLPTSSLPTATLPLPSVLDVPSEYLHESDDQKLCEQLFGASYLKSIATHQQPYCEPESLGALQCFTAPRHPAPWHSDWQSDTLCIAQGVHFGTPDMLSVGGKQGVRFASQCRPRNLTREAQAPDTAAEELEGLPELDSMPTYWFDTGIGPTFRSWHFENRGDEAGCTKANANNQWLLLARRERNTNIWHKMTEIW